MTVRPLFDWHALWVGASWVRRTRTLQILPLPMIGIAVQFRRIPPWEGH